MRYNLINRIFPTEAITIVVTIVCLLIGINILSTETVNEKNTYAINRHFKSIKEDRTARGGLSYDLFIQEDQRPFKIGANDVDCFYHDSFISNVHSDQPIKIIIRKNNGILTFFKIPFIVSITTDHAEYLSIGCVNNGLQTQKLIAGFLFIPALFVIGFFIYRFMYMRINKAD